MIIRFGLDSLTAPVSEGADCLRLLLHQYTEATGMKTSNSCTPYIASRYTGLNFYVERLLLRIDPTVDPNSSREFNYFERKLAMFLSFMFLSISANSDLTIWCQLRAENKNLLRHVILFLWQI